MFRINCPNKGKEEAYFPKCRTTTLAINKKQSRVILLQGHFDRTHSTVEHEILILHEVDNPIVPDSCLVFSDIHLGYEDSSHSRDSNLKRIQSLSIFVFFSKRKHWQRHIKKKKPQKLSRKSTGELSTKQTNRPLHLHLRMCRYSVFNNTVNIAIVQLIFVQKSVSTGSYC